RRTSNRRLSLGSPVLGGGGIACVGLACQRPAPTMFGMNRSLFDADDRPPLAARLAPSLRSLAERGVCFGTSSWKYEGWLGTAYSPERYLTRRKFSRKRFAAECLREYAETFPVVGGDFSFYQFPTADYWTRLFGSTPPTFAFGLKVPEQLTV